MLEKAPRLSEQFTSISGIVPMLRIILMRFSQERNLRSERAAYLLEGSWALFVLGSFFLYPLFEVWQIFSEQRGLHLSAERIASALAAQGSAAREYDGQRRAARFDWYRWQSQAGARQVAQQVASGLPEGQVPGACLPMGVRCERRVRSVDTGSQRIAWKPDRAYIESLIEKELTRSFGRRPALTCRSKGCVNYEVKAAQSAGAEPGYTVKLSYLSPSSPMLAKILQNRGSLALQSSSWQALSEEAHTGRLRFAQPDGVEKYDGP